MDSHNAQRTSRGMQAALAGFQAGMLAVLVMLAWLGLASAWYGHTFWMPANLMASTFYGPDAVRAGFTFATLSGLALYVIAYSALGAAAGWALHGQKSRARVFLMAILFGLAWYYLWWAGLWHHLNGLITLYTHDRPMLVGHLLYGLWLGRFPHYLPRPSPAVTEPVSQPL
ncbi:MAG: hypothetical protein M1541_00170 [Acidobacteria bacterium]|nr:hypothetical protein [Acidobacteriota bacterium]